jgi:hypothetical protein
MATTNQPPTAPYSGYSDRTRTTLSDQQIAQAAYNAGFRGTALSTAVAIALAESHGNTTALNDHGEFSVGMFQINVNGYLGSRLHQWGFSSWQDLWDPNKNAQAAYKISGGGQHFGAWSTYKHGTYLKYTSRANAAAKQVDPNAGPIAVPVGYSNNSTDPANQAGAQSFLNWFNAQGALNINAFTNWSDILSRYTTATGDNQTAAYVSGILDKFGVDKNVAIGPAGFQHDQPGGLALSYLSSVAGADAGIFQPALDFVNGFVGDIRWGFYVIILLVVGLVVVLVGFKVKPDKSE